MARFLSVIVLLLIISKSALSVPSCGEVVSDLAPCLRFLRGKETKPRARCCSGVKELKGLAKTKADRVAICNCGKKAGSNFEIDSKKVTILPKKCGVDIKMPAIGKNFDCSKVKLEDLL
ncbi:hypothetical protein ACJIZ3_018554 [Penstemon smallii]|uniref:Non-specific lipid-transfer protein n=1 Tax=Penstemon smallii TaxID=265156 RepID=A0ABD3SYS0_9LAMI